MPEVDKSLKKIVSYFGSSGNITGNDVSEVTKGISSLVSRMDVRGDGVDEEEMKNVSIGVHNVGYYFYILSLFYFLMSSNPF